MSEYVDWHTNPPLEEIKPVIPVPITQGGITAVAGSTKIPLGMVSGPSVSGVPLFPPDHIWNTRIDSLPVDPHSAEYIGLSEAQLSPRRFRIRDMKDTP